jgi:RNA polymerase sporulation-specific sigma factor
MTKQERDQMVEDNLPLVNTIASKYVKANSKREFDDIFQIGCMGLVKAVDKFDSSKGFKFSTYAYRLIEGEIINNVNRKEEKLVDTVGIDDYVNGYEGQTIQDTLEDESIGEYEFIENDSFNRLLKGLTRKQIRVMQLRFGNGLRRVETSRFLNITKQAVYLIEKKAIENIRMSI